MVEDRTIIHHATYWNPARKEARHLLIDLVDGAKETQLIQLSHGHETLIATGTQFEMTQKANELAKLWIDNEGFEFQPGDKPAYEPLGHTIALAVRMGFKVVYDPASGKTSPPHMNFTGAVPLTAWSGLTAKNGGSYVYAFDGMMLLARPTLPSWRGTVTAPTGGREFAAFMLKIKAELDGVGPFREFILGD